MPGELVLRLQEASHLAFREKTTLDGRAEDQIAAFVFSNIMVRSADFQNLAVANLHLGPSFLDHLKVSDDLLRRAGLQVRIE